MAAILAMVNYAITSCFSAALTKIGFQCNGVMADCLRYFEVINLNSILAGWPNEHGQSRRIIMPVVLLSAIIRQLSMIRSVLTNETILLR